MFVCKNMLQMIYHSIVCYCTLGIVEPIWDKSASYTISTNVCICLRTTFAHHNRCRWSFFFLVLVQTRRCLLYLSVDFGKSYWSVSFLLASNITPVNCKENWISARRCGVKVKSFVEQSRNGSGVRPRFHLKPFKTFLPPLSFNFISSQPVPLI